MSSLSHLLLFAQEVPSEGNPLAGIVGLAVFVLIIAAGI